MPSVGQPFGQEQRLKLDDPLQPALAIEGLDRPEQAVREKHESEALLQASANGILVVNGYGRVVDMNPALERLTGWTLREARGEPCCDVVGCQVGQAAEGPELSACPLQVSRTGKDRAFLEYQLRTHDGQSIPVEASYGLIRGEDGETERIIMVFRDLSPLYMAPTWGTLMWLSSMKTIKSSGK